MIIDCHTHMHFPHRDVDAADHIEACEKVTGCIVLPVSAPGESGFRTNELLSEYVEKYRKMVGFAVINPITDPVDVNSVKKITGDLNLQGIVIYCASQNCHPANSRAMRLYETAATLELPVFFSNSAAFNRLANMEYSQPYLLDEIARSFESLKIIIGSAGTPFYLQTMCLLSKHDHIYADLAFFPHKIWELYNVVVSAHEWGVMDKLLFGSGYPFAKPIQCLETLLGFNKLIDDHHLRMVPREKIRSIVERDTFSLLNIAPNPKEPVPPEKRPQ